MNINVLNLYPSNRINALHSIKVEDIQPSLVYPGLEEVVQSIQQARPVENPSNSNVQVARPPSTSTSNNSTPNRVRRSRAPSAPVSLASASIKASSAAIFRKSNQKYDDIYTLFWNNKKYNSILFVLYDNKKNYRSVESAFKTVNFVILLYFFEEKI